MLHLRRRPGSTSSPGADALSVDPADLDALGLTWDSLADEVATGTWFHRIDLSHGIHTPGRDPTAAKFAALELPDLTGRTVIDIGAFDGFFSFACEQRGAARVVAADHRVWTWPGSDARRNFELLRQLLTSAVEAQEVPVEGMSAATCGTFDVTLFLGVLYHAPDMLGYLRAARSVTRELLVLETLVDCLDVKRPAVAYYPQGTFPGDDSNHWGPNPASVEGMLVRAGFSRVERKRLWSRRVLTKVGARAPRGLTNGRMVFHAWV